MIQCTTVLLRHAARSGAHYDWLIALPGRERCWTARVPWPSRHWRAAGRFVIEPIGWHRRWYLTHQGPVPGDRGDVLRVDHGVALLRLWTDSRAVLDLRLRDFSGTVQLQELGAATRRAFAVEQAEC